MFVRRCARKDMSAYFETTTALELPMRTRLLLPFGCHVRTYSAIWLSRTLRKWFSPGSLYADRLVSVFRDQIVFTERAGSDELANLIVDACNAPFEWSIAHEPVCLRKLEQQYAKDLSKETPKLPPAPPLRTLRYRCAPIAPIRLSSLPR